MGAKHSTARTSKVEWKSSEGKQKRQNCCIGTQSWRYTGSSLSTGGGIATNNDNSSSLSYAASNKPVPSTGPPFSLTPPSSEISAAEGQAKHMVVTASAEIELQRPSPATSRHNAPNFLCTGSTSARVELDHIAAAIAENEKKHRNELFQLEARHKAEADKLRKEIEDMQIAHDEELGKLHSIKELELIALRDAHQESIHALQQQICAQAAVPAGGAANLIEKSTITDAHFDTKVQKAATVESCSSAHKLQQTPLMPQKGHAPSKVIVTRNKGKLDMCSDDMATESPQVALRGKVEKDGNEKAQRKISIHRLRYTAPSTNIGGWSSKRSHATAGSGMNGGEAANSRGNNFVFDLTDFP